MEFNFPDNKLIINSTIYNRVGTSQYGQPITIENPKDNFITIDGIGYYFTYLNGASPGNKGGNSIILNLYESQTFDEVNTGNIEYGDPDIVLKISNSKNSSNLRFPSKKEKRFKKEIDALKKCNAENFQNVIKIFHDGTCKIRNVPNTSYDEYLFYTMEYANNDLKKYIELNHNRLELYEKIELSISLCEGLKELFSLGYYHRDIKPDNIFMIDSLWKIGDLGLIAERNSLDMIDNIAERIGPAGWLSPESMNKFLCEGKNFEFDHNCFIDHQSDIFQLGKVFWYIFQYNAPIGVIKEKDFMIKHSRIYQIVRTMLNHSKKRRYTEINDIIRLLKIEADKLFVKAA